VTVHVLTLPSKTTIRRRPRTAPSEIADRQLSDPAASLTLTQTLTSANSIVRGFDPAALRRTLGSRGLRHATKHSFSHAWASILADRQEVH
jgi:hypothetical protein